MDFGTLLFGFSGRINRAKYWLAVLIYIVVSVVLQVLALALGQGMIMMVLGLIVGIGMIVSGIAIGIKRLHDRNKSGWLLLAIYLVPAILIGLGFWLALALGSAIIMWVLYLVALAIWVWAFVELGCLRGTVGPNQYGPDPLTPGA